MPIDPATGLPTKSERFLIRSPILPDESLLGFIARTASDNVHSSLAHALRRANITTINPQRLHRNPGFLADNLAFILGCPPSAVITRRYIRTGTSGYFSFFGDSLPDKFREFRLRRVCPQTLRISAHHRGIWDLTVFDHCPHTGGRIISVCPACEAPLRWKYSYGIHICETCKYDLRKFQTSVARGFELDALRRLCALANPMSELRKSVWEWLPSGTDLGKPAQWLVFCAAIVPWLKGGLEKQSIDHSVLGAHQNAALSPNSAALVCDWIVGLPNSAFLLFDRLRSAAGDRKGIYGVEKDLGVLFGDRASYLTRNGAARHFVKDLVSEYYAQLKDPIFRGPEKCAVMADGSLTTLKGIRERFKLTANMLRRLYKAELVRLVRPSTDTRTPILVNTQHIEKIAERRRELIRADHAHRLLGIPEHTFFTLCADGYFCREDGSAAVMAGSGEWFAQTEIDKVRNLLFGTHQSQVTAAEKKISIGGLVADHRLSARAWTPLVRAAIDGTIRLSLRNVSPGVNEVTIAPSDILCLDELPQENWKENLTSAPKTMSTTAAAIFLNVNETRICEFLRVNFLLSAQKGSARHRPLRSSVYEFGSTYITSTEIQFALRVGRGEARNILSDYGIRPVRTWNVCNFRRHLWLRAQILALPECRNAFPIWR